MTIPNAPVRVRLRMRGLNQLMRSAPVQREVNKHAARIMSHAGGSRFQVRPSPHRWVARAYVELERGGVPTHQERIDLLRAVTNARK